MKIGPQIQFLWGKWREIKEGKINKKLIRQKTVEGYYPT